MMGTGHGGLGAADRGALWTSGLQNETESRPIALSSPTPGFWHFLMAALVTHRWQQGLLRCELATNSRWGHDPGGLEGPAWSQASCCKRDVRTAEAGGVRSRSRGVQSPLEAGEGEDGRGFLPSCLGQEGCPVVTWILGFLTPGTVGECVGFILSY